MRIAHPCPLEQEHRASLSQGLRPHHPRGECWCQEIPAWFQEAPGAVGESRGPPDGQGPSRGHGESVQGRVGPRPLRPLHSWGGPRCTASGCTSPRLLGNPCSLTCKVLGKSHQTPACFRHREEKTEDVRKTPAPPAPRSLVQRVPPPQPKRCGRASLRGAEPRPWQPCCLALPLRPALAPDTHCLLFSYSHFLCLKSWLYAQTHTHTILTIF